MTTDAKTDLERSDQPDEHRKRRRVVSVLQTGRGGVIPHPALDVPVDEKEQARSRGVDWVVFGVTAVIALGFLVWGFVSTPSLKSVSGSALTWTMENTGWLFVLTSSGFVLFVLWLALSRFGAIPLGRDDEVLALLTALRDGGNPISASDPTMGFVKVVT